MFRVISNINFYSIPLIIIGFSLVLKIFLINGYPGFGGDSDTYKNVALNIFQNACISISPAASKECIPHWGGNQLPGYPLYLAINYYFFGVNDTMPLISSSIFFSIALIFFTTTLRNIGHSLRSTSIILLCLAFSPVYFASARFLLTEHIIIAFTLLLINEILNSLNKKTNVIMLATIFSILFFIRYDSIALIPAIAYLLFCSEKLKQKAFKELTKFFLLLSLPITVISINHNINGLSIIPKELLVSDGSPSPKGYIKWAETFIFNSYHQETVTFPIAKKKYSSIKIPYNVGLSAACRSRSQKLIDQLANYENQVFPQHLDLSFEKLSRDPDCFNKMKHFFILPLKRSVSIWFTLPNSFWWPTTESGLRIKIFNALEDTILKKDINSIVNLADVFRGNILAIFVRVVANVYWVILILGFFGLTIVSLRNNNSNSLFLKFTLIYIASKLIFVFLFATTYETRILTGAIPFMELSILLFLFGIKKKY